VNITTFGQPFILHKLFIPFILEKNTAELELENKEKETTRR
jgi:hypothetical protein